MKEANAKLNDGIIPSGVIREIHFEVGQNSDKSGMGQDQDTSLAYSGAAFKCS